MADSDFYSFAAATTKAVQAVSQTSSSVTVYVSMKHIWDLPSVENDGTVNTPPDPILLELENIMIQDLFNLPFVYLPLSGANAIRILILHGGSSGEPLRGTLEHTIVETGTGYHAISYSWGDSSTPCSILLEGCQMPLTQSLFNTLVRLRYPNKDRQLWADGLCINQSDNVEKAAQVALMPQIYTYAGRVLVHLGMEADGSELLPDLLSKLEKANASSSRVQMLSSEEFLSHGLPSPDDGVWKALVAFFCRPWFLRVWIIQEVILARDIRFFCGSWELRWELLANVAQQFAFIITSNPHIYELIWTHDFQNAQYSALSLGLVLDFRLTRSTVATRLKYLRSAIELNASTTSAKKHIESLAQDVMVKRDFVIQSCREHRQLYPLVERIMVALDVVKPSTTPILKLLGKFPRNAATKPQDRLYALIGLAADINLEEFPPDYEENEDQTNTRFAKKLVQKGKGMEILFHATKTSIELLNLATPSWVANWTPRRPMHSHWLKLGWEYHRYPGDFEPQANPTSSISLVEGPEEGPHVLRVFGVSVDRLDSIVKLYEDSCDYDVAAFLKASQKYFQRIEDMMDNNVYFTGETYTEAICKTLVAGHTDKMGNSFSEILHYYQEAKSNLTNLPSKSSRRPENPWSDEWFRLMPDFAICKTSKGYVGLVPQATDSTDEIFMLQGSNLPFVLRPVPQIPRLYRFVGGCYMHGLMDGGAWHLRQTLLELFIF